MSGPWENYAPQQEAPAAPWEKYAAQPGDDAPADPSSSQYANFGERALAERGGTVRPRPDEFQIDVGPSGLGSIPGAVSKAAQTVQAFAKEGVPPSLATTGGWAGRTMTKIAEALPGGGIVGRPLSRAVDATGQAVERTAGKYGVAAGAEEAGQAIKSGIEGWKGRFTADAERLYGEVGKAIPEGTAVNLNNTASTLSDITSRFPTSEKLAKLTTPSEFPQISDAITEAGGKLSWGEASNLRSYIGRKLGSPTLGSDIDRAALKRTYQSLTDDLEAAANASGPKAAAAWKEANGFYKAGSERLDKHLVEIFDAKSAEAAYGKVTRAAKSGSGQNLQRLRELKDSLAPAEFDDVASAVLRETGAPTPGSKFAGADFSPTTFSTNWNKLAPEARDILFGAKGTPGRESIENIATISDKLKSVEAAGNPSGSARQLIGGGMVAGGMTDLGTTAASTAATLGLGRAMVSPGIARVVAGNAPTLGEVGVQTAAGAGDLLINPERRKALADQLMKGAGR